MKLKLLTILVFSFFIIVCLSAQKNVSGQILDKAGSPIDFASIAIFDKGHLISGSESHNQGKFQIEVASTSTLEFSCIGYRNKSFSVKDIGESFTVTLEEANYELTEVVVVAKNYYDRGGIACVLIRPYSYQHKEKAVEEQGATNSWNVFPNPTTGSISVKQMEGKKGFIEVINSTGQILTQVPVQDFRTDISLHSFPNGTYFLRFINKESTEYIGQVIKIME